MSHKLLKNTKSNPTGRKKVHIVLLEKMCLSTIDQGQDQCNKTVPTNEDFFLNLYRQTIKKY